MKFRFLIPVLLVLFPTACSRSHSMVSPNGRIAAEIFTTKEGSLAYTVSRDGRILCDTSALGVTIDGRKIFCDVRLRLTDSRKRNETYPVRGAHAKARDHAWEYRWEVTHHPTGYRYTLETRLYDDGFAYRFILPGQGERRVAGEAAQWRLPFDSRVWFAERNSNWKLLTYAGEWIQAPASELATISEQGPVQTMPLLYQTRDSLYLMVTEAALYEYSGMRLRADTDGSLHADFTEKGGFLLHDTVMTPWRVLIVAENLSQLVNTDLITNLNPAPNPDLFADTSWIRPGRSLWSWWSGINGRYMTLEGEREVIDLAASMGYEYSTLDEGWEELPDKWKTLRKLANHAAEKGVGLFVWRHWKRLNDPADNYAELQHFLDSVAGCGIRGVKIDFMNGEGLQQIRFTTAVLEQAAKRHLLVNFHGCQKPSGESRTYPNELTREGVRGLELNRITVNYLKRMRAAGISVSDRKTLPGDENRNIPASHNATLPFTRCVTGPADYTPVAFSMPGDVLPAQQLACAYLIGSPLITLAENPFYLLKEKRLQPAVEFLRELPTCWDETVVLPQSRIGELALMARRSGATWYLAAAAAINFQGKIPLDFLGPGLWRATILEDDGKNGFLRSERTLEADTSIPLALQSNAGCVIRFVRQ